MGSVLIVDDELSFLLSLADGLKSFDENLSIYTAINGLAAVSILESKQVDLVVTDLKMPIMDGFELLVYLHNNYNSIPVIIITSYGRADIEHYFEDTGGIQYMEKPLDFLELAVRITEGLAHKTKGIANGVKLSQFMQFLEVVNKSCSLTVFSGRKLGHLFFNQGKLLDAQYGDHSGAEAAIAMASWRDPQLILNNSYPERQYVIKLPIRKLLMWAKVKNIYETKKRSTKSEQKRSDEKIIEMAGTEVDLVNGMVSQLDREFTPTMEEKLREFEAIDGFCCVGIYSQDDESLYTLTSEKEEVDVSDFGKYVRGLLENVHDTASRVGIGNEKLVSIETEGERQILIKSLDGFVDPAKARKNNTNKYLLLIFSSSANLRLAKLKLATILKLLAPDLR